MRIGIDIDNVISNFDEELLKEFLKHDKELRGTGIVNNETYITKGMFDWTKEEQDDFYSKNIERIAKKLDVINNAPEYIKKLREKGYEIYIISGRDNEDYSKPYEMTVNWLKKHKIQYDKLILTNAYDSLEKAKVCMENDIKIMIDDSIRILKEVNNTNTIALLMDTPYNKSEKSLIRVNNWEEIYEYITQYKKEKLNVILDTDTYNECDDQFALSYMLKSQDIFNIEAITVAPYSHKERNETVISGREKSYNEILKICNWLKFDTTDKVFKGAEDYICNGYDKSNDAVNKIIIKVHNQLKIGRISNIPSELLADAILDNVEIYLKIKSNV